MKQQRSRAALSAWSGTWLLGSLLVGCTPPDHDSQPGGASTVDVEQVRDPGEVDDALIAAIQEERFAAAYGLTTRAYRDSVPLETFARAMKMNRYLMTSKLIGCHRTVTYGAVHRRECIMESAAGSAYATLYYAMDEGEWRMTGIVIGGTSAFPGPGSMGTGAP